MPARTTIWSRRSSLAACSVVVAATAAYLAPIVTQGWVPFDEGMLGQVAHRVLLGQLPHRDFEDVYTGGLAMLHAGSFLLFGENLVSLRWVFFAAVLLTAPIVYYIASRFARPIFATATSVVVVMASFPSYVAAMPSWFNLIFALACMAALLRFVERGGRRWLVAAGACAGLSILMKIVGVFLVAGGALALTVIACASGGGHRPPGRRSAPLPGIALAIVAAAAIPYAIMWRHLRWAEALELGIPVIAVCGAGAHRVWQASGRAEAAASGRRMWATLWPFALGVSVPLAVFVVPYVQTHAMAPLLRGVFVLPRLRLEWTPIDGPPPLALIVGLPLLALLVYRRFSAQRVRRPDVFLIAIIEFGLVGASAFSLELTAVLWNMVRMAAPLVVVASAIQLSGRGFTNAWSTDAQRLFVAASIAAWCALLQFPTDSYQYFLYVLPLPMLAAGFLASMRQTPSRAVASVTLVAFGGLALLSRPVFIHGGGSHAVLLSEPRAVLDLPRGGLTIRRNERDEYISLVALIRAHSKSRYIYASPDAPEVYFLAERENPTRTLFDFFDDPHDRTARVMSAIRMTGADVAVINSAPRFSEKVPVDLYDSLAMRFDSSARVGFFEVRCRRCLNAGITHPPIRPKLRLSRPPWRLDGASLLRDAPHVFTEDSGRQQLDAAQEENRQGDRRDSGS